ncbi:MAG TPA: glycosyltransferase family 4 protein [Rubricoccaceae bacterium]|nr:glycosyltransferase family 4 protein [Rubricoccaceae bacterium]
MHILYVYQFYNTPDCATTAKHYVYFRHLTAQGHRVSLVTSRTFLEQRLTHAFEWLPEGVDVHYVDVRYANEMGSAARLRAYATYMVRALTAALRFGRPDVVVGVSTPLTAAWAARQVARVRGVPWVFEVEDLWPDFPIQMGAIKSPLAQRVLRRAERALYRSADHIIAHSPDMASHILAHGGTPERLTTLVNGTDFDLLDRVPEARLAELRAQHGLTAKKVVLYAGKYGRANDIPLLIRAAERLAGRDDVRFVFTGYGFLAPLVEEAAQRLPNVVALPGLPKHLALEWFRVADLSLVSFIGLPILATNSPSKLYDSLGAGTPVIVTNPGWTKRLVERHGVGRYVPAGDADALAAAIEEVFADEAALAEMGRRGRALAEAEFDRAAHVRRVEAIFEAVVHGETLPPYHVAETPTARSAVLNGTAAELPEPADALAR